MKRTAALLAAAVMILLTVLLALPGAVIDDDQAGDPVTQLASVSQPDDLCIDQQLEFPQITPLDSDKQNKKIIVAVLDTGIDEQHKDLAGKVIASFNFSDSPTTSDVKGHGTHIAGIIAATVNKNNSITGDIPEVSFLNVKVADDKGRVWPSAVARGITCAVDNGADIINMSFYVTQNTPALEQAVEYAWSKGVVLVAATGNNVKSPAAYPAYYPQVVSVAAIDAEGNLWPGSNDGDWVDAYAPGVMVYSALPHNRYGYKSGTSMAAAYVSAMAVLDSATVADLNSNGLTNDEVAVLLKETFAHSEEAPGLIASGLPEGKKN